jgi:hypothetical protein
VKRYIISILYLVLFYSCSNAQNRSDIESGLSFFSKSKSERIIEYRENMFYDNSNSRMYNIGEQNKDSIRNYLASHGSYSFDYEFDVYHISLKNGITLNEAFIKKNCPVLYSKINDKEYNKLYYDFANSGKETTIFVAISKNYIELDPVRYAVVDKLPGSNIFLHEITIKGASKKLNLFLRKGPSLNRLYNKETAPETINIDEKGNFTIKFDGNEKANRFFVLEDEFGAILTIAKF